MTYILLIKYLINISKIKNIFLINYFLLNYIIFK